ncbi:p21-activated protein kinase-interacting protein 1 [Heterocephalus glaber]|uniref:p21-activated protein kinase-interacting protein 1 n=1 Tax=Heterocephalus glaber TaxID=10181 RepID=G5BWD7_HETGA|nr:p21-activated protein kinase-interacting protein 1 [Heterocephalus glaber]
MIEPFASGSVTTGVLRNSRERHVYCRMELLAGSYEQVLFGFTVHPDPEVNGGHEKWTSVADFTHHAHTASLSAVAVNSRFVVPGSKDETIHIYDMKKKIDHGALVHHKGSRWSTITCLKFYGNRHLISGGKDGLICVCDAKKWECLKSVKAHKGHVTFLSIHPSGKLALSAEPSPVSEEQARISKKESAAMVQAEAASRPDPQTRGLGTDSEKQPEGRSLGSNKKRKVVEMLEKKKGKKKKI